MHAGVEASQRGLALQLPHAHRTPTRRPTAPSPCTACPAVAQPLNNRTVRIYVDAPPCISALAALAANNTLPAQALGVAAAGGVARYAPLSIRQYQAAAQANLTAPLCEAKPRNGAAARTCNVAVWAAVAAGAAAALAAGWL